MAITMEELKRKARAYDEALERAKKNYDVAQDLCSGSQIGVECFKNTLTNIFPELKESEDERIRKSLISYLHGLGEFDYPNKETYNNWLDWLEKQGKQIIDCPQNHQDTGHPNGCIVMEDFNGGEGFYKLNLDYLNKKQVREIEEIVKAWNTKSNDDIIRDEIIKVCVGMALTDVPQSRFESYGTSLKECLTWLEKQGEKHVDKVEPKFKVKYAGSEYNVFETKDIAGVTFYGIEDEPNHIDYVKAENCEIISVYAIKENGSPYPTKPAVFSEKKPKRMISAEAKEAARNTFNSLPFETRKKLANGYERLSEVELLLTLTPYYCQQWEVTCKVDDNVRQSEM